MSSELSVYNPNSVLQTKAYNGGYYTHTRLYPQSNSGNPTINTASGNSVQVIDLPNNVFNLSESFLRFDMISAAPATNAGAWFLNAPPINRMSLQTRSGQFLADIPNFRQYWKLCVPTFVESSDYYSRPSALNADSLANARIRGLCKYYQPSNGLPTTALVADTQNGVYVGIDGKQAYTATSSSVAKYTNPASIIAGAGTTASALACEVQFKDIPYSIFSMNKDFYSAEALQLVIELCPAVNTAYEVKLADGSAQLSLAVTMSNFSLYLAIEQNKMLVDSLINKVMNEGLNILIPYPTVQSIALGTATSGSVQVKLNRGQGAHCLRILSAEFVSSDTLGTSHNAYNVGGALTSIYQTQLDSVNLQQEQLSATLGTDYMFNQKFLRKSAIQSYGDYEAWAPVHCDEWVGLQELTQAKEVDYMAQNNALSLDVEHTYNKVISTKSAVATNCILAIICQKALSSSARGVQVQ
jgi:hypothetical protein